METKEYTTAKVMMIRPKRFRFNEETAGDNTFQKKGAENSSEIALKEFDSLVNRLQKNGVEVMVVNDSDAHDTPDAVFPNNWISTHANGTIVLYPMYAENRRKEIRQEIIDQLSTEYGYNEVIDWTTFAETNQFLEGTGSFVLDRNKQIAYACISERTNKELAQQWGETMNYEVICFSAVDRTGKAIYHTNVMMNISEQFAVVCLESIHKKRERELVHGTLEQSGKEVIPISYEQMEQFAGNMLTLKNKNDESLLVLSETAYESLTQKQLSQLTSFAKPVVAPIPVIEENGGGSVRCMIAELF